MKLEQALYILRHKNMFASVALYEDCLFALKIEDVSDHHVQSIDFTIEASEYRSGTQTRKAFDIVEEWMKIHQVKRIDFDI
jgi:hypothetical protein